jgi:molybdenum cofactor biosynthesis protein B
MSDSTASHRQQAASDERSRSIPCAVLTVSDSRTAETDESGSLVARLLRDAGHVPAAREIVPDEPEAIRTSLEAWARDPGVSVILCTGGTGVGRRDSTIEVVSDALERELVGFGELFRMISFHEIGAAAMLSRAVAGLLQRPGGAAAGGDTFIFAMPGSTNAVETAMTRLILPELPHLVWDRLR